jgi:hypothetical protein
LYGSGRWICTAMILYIILEVILLFFNAFSKNIKWIFLIVDIQFLIYIIIITFELYCCSIPMI